MTVTWDCVEKLENKELINEFEQLINWQLPESFRAFITENNSCCPAQRTCFKTSDGEERVLRNIYDFNKGSVISIWDFCDFPEEDRRWFKEQYGGELNDYVAFADDVLGNSVCFDKNSGKVTLYDREADKMSIIADDFTAFLDKLYVSEEENTVD